jgi:hypothetical protein
MDKAQAVASVCFLDNRSISMDVEAVIGIDLGLPMEVGDGQWFCELIVRSSNGVVALQMLSNDPSRFTVNMPEPREEDSV